MKTTFTLAFALATFWSYGQSIDIPNGDFENWTFNGWNYEPENWFTENFQLIEHVTQDTDAYEGDYAMKVTYSNETALVRQGHATVLIPTTETPSALLFHVKTEAQASMLGVEVVYHIEDAIVYTEQWSTTESINAWTPVTLALDDVAFDIDHISIDVFFQGGDDAVSEGWISVDAMSFDTSNSILDETSDQESIWFDYSTQHLVKSKEGETGWLELHTVDGSLVERKLWNDTRLKIPPLAKGIYLASFISTSGERASAIRIAIE